MEGPEKAPGDLHRRCEEALERVRPFLERDGGTVELVRVDEGEGIAYVRLRGACSGCPLSGMTLRLGIEHEVRTSVPEIRQVVAV